MSPVVRLVTLSVALGAALVAEVACKSAKPDACMVDTDCPQGSFCREGLCAAVNGSDGGGTDAEPAGCGSAQNPCPDQDSGVGSSSGSSCRDVYGLCSSDFDCCASLSCRSGACR